MSVINGEHLARDVVVVAASAGGVELILRLAGALPGDLPAGVAIVIHRSPDATGSLIEILSRRAHMRAIEPNDATPFAHGTLYLAPPNRHLVLRNKMFWRDAGPKVRFTRPAADPLFRSAAAEFGPRVVGVVLSGGDYDGSEGCLALKAAGGISLAQDPREALHPSMPVSTIAANDVNAVLPMEGIITTIIALAHGREITI